ncbi:MAG: TolC family outer membrane protein [Pseudomonadota bacterium]
MTKEVNWHLSSEAVAHAPRVMLLLLLSTVVHAQTDDDYPNVQDFQVVAPDYAIRSRDTMLDVYLRAKSFDAEYMRARQQHAADSESYKQARGRLLPELSIYAEERRTDQDIVASDIEVIGEGQTEFDTTVYGANLSMPIFDWERFMRLNQSKRERMLADARLLQAEQALLLRVAERYLSVLAAQDNLEYTRREEAAVQEQVTTAQTRFEADVGREVDFLEAKARAASVYADKVSAQNILEDAIEGIREISGAGSENYARLSESIEIGGVEPNVLDPWIQSAMEGSLAVQIQREALWVASYEIKRQRSNRYPTFSLYARADKNDQGGSLFGGASDVETLEYGVRFNMNLFEGGATSSRVREAAYRYNSELETLQENMRQTTRETRSAFNDLKTSISRIESLETSAEAQETVVESKRKGYPSLFTIRDVLDSERDLYSIKRDLAKARYDYLLADFRLKAAVGSLSEQDLERINALFE